MGNKIAIIFPGVGYHSDKPLLYYGKKLAADFQYEILDVKYGGFDSDLKGNPEKMRAAFESALQQAETVLKKYVFSLDDEILVISKSVGTVVAAAWEKRHGIICKNIFFTPVKETFQFTGCNSGIVFHGTKDSWAKTDDIVDACKRLRLPLFLKKNANHSLETGNALTDAISIQGIIVECQSYLLNLDVWENCDICKPEPEKVVDPDSEICEHWKIIKEQIVSLSYEPYIDDQLEIDTVWEECRQMVDFLQNHDIEFALKRNLLKTIVDNGYYDEYGCYDPMHDLSRALCKCKEDKLLLADILWAAGKFHHKEAAEISLENGKEDYYIQYLYESLGKKSEPYTEAMNYFLKTDRYEQALQVAEKGLTDCKYDQTDIYVFLIRDAQMKKNAERITKLVDSAKRKHRVDYKKIQEMI